MYAMRLFEIVSGYVGKFHYVALFTILFLCGIGLPIPEEVTLVTGGYFIYLEECEFVRVCVACIAGILAGDAVLFALGRHWGDDLLRHWLVRWVLSPRHAGKVVVFFKKHGVKAVFFARFLPGVRMGVYVLAGSQGMRWICFLLLDLLGALISATISIYVGWTFGSHIEQAHRHLRGINRTAAVVIILAAALLFSIHILLRRRRMRTVASRAGIGSPAGPPAPSGAGGTEAGPSGSPAPREERSKGSP